MESLALSFAEIYGLVGIERRSHNLDGWSRQVKVSFLPCLLRNFASSFLLRELSQQRGQD